MQTFTRGCLTVFIVVVAIELLDTGDPGVGILTAAVGAGGMLGSVLAFGLVGRGRLALWFGVGIALFGAPLVVIGAVPEQAVAILLLGVVGIGNALIDVGGFTLLARLTDERVLARMFAGFEAILTLGIAAGALVTPLVVDLLGVRWALVAAGLLAPLAVAASWPALRRLDAEVHVRDGDIETMRAVRMLGALPVATIEQLAGGLEHVGFTPGRDVFLQGDHGAYFYVVEDGHADVNLDGRLVTTLGGGDCFGEIALLRDQPRLATVRASGNAQPTREPAAAQRLPDRRDRLPRGRGRGRAARQGPARGNFGGSLLPARRPIRNREAAGGGPHLACSATGRRDPKLQE